VGMGAGAAMGQMFAQSMNAANQPQAAQPVQAATVPCVSCGKQIPQGSKFCSHCGAAQVKQEKTCAKCGAKLAADAKFCPECGQKAE